MDDSDRMIITQEQAIKNLKERLDNLEEQSKAINDLAISVKELAINMKVMSEKQSDQSERLSKLESKPIKRWEQILQIILTTVVGALITIVLIELGIKK